jgi:acetolactate synthase-1/3 small subunit
LYKVSTELLLNSDKIENLLRKSGGRIVEVTPKYTVIEKMGSAEDIQELFSELKKISLLQFTRSGRIAVTRLSQELLNNYLIEENIVGLGV